MDQVELTHAYVEKVLCLFDAHAPGGPWRRGGAMADAVYDVLEDLVEEYKAKVGITTDPESELDG